MNRLELRFGGNREKAIQRDGEKCVSCGMERDVHIKTYSRDITVDHIDGNGRHTPRPLQNNSLDNLQTLCLPCHGKKDVQRRKTYENVFTKRNGRELIDWAGESLTIPEWANKLGLNKDTLYCRIKTRNWPIEKALTKGV